MCDVFFGESRLRRARRARPGQCAGMPGRAATAQRYGRLVLHGRERERAQLAALVEQARAGTGAVLVVLGEPGVGKTALLRDLTTAQRPSRQSGDVRVLRTAGVESESPLPYAALHRLLRPVMIFDRLPGPAGAGAAGRVRPRGRAHRRTVPGRGRHPVRADRRSRTGRPAPVRGRRRALARLRVRGRVAVRGPSAGRRPCRHGLRRPNRRHGRRARSPRRACPCSRSAASTTTPPVSSSTSAAADPLPGGVADRLVRDTGGNPLALLELPTGLSPAQLHGQAAAAATADVDRRGGARVPGPVPPPAASRCRRCCWSPPPTPPDASPPSGRQPPPSASTRPRGRTPSGPDSADHRRRHRGGAAPAGPFRRLPGGDQLRTTPGAPRPR